MKKKGNITSLPKLRKEIDKYLKFLVKNLKKDFKKEGGENFFLRYTAKLIWILLLFNLSKVISFHLEKDLIVGTGIFLLILSVSHFLSIRTWAFVKGEFFDEFGGWVLRFSLIILTVAFSFLFIWPGILIHPLNNALKQYEKK